ncbi:MAG TPA: hypothetical protein VHM91_21075 [Verrucomicrobiales bacterium]|jgi:hypothetical protein|nr:hypothetical protein [Verrucomicrobiales bacterium]
MDALPLLLPSVSDAAVLPGGYFYSTQMSTEWNGTWQNARVNRGDAAAWGLVVFFLVTLGLVAGCAAAALTRPRGPSKEHLLIDEVLSNEDQLAAGPATSSPEAPWEKPADWWKTDG